LAVNLKIIFEGEEEAGSTIVQRTLELHKNLLGADLLITADGPVHQSGGLWFLWKPRDIGIDVTVYGPCARCIADIMGTGRRIQRWNCRGC